MTSAEIEFLWCNPGNWKLGFFYYCPSDPRVIVPKGLRLGWTLNFARPLALPALAGMVAFLFGPFYFCGLLNIDLHGYDWLLLIILVVALSLFCSRAASTRRFD